MGLAIDLPAPMTKAAAESWPLRIEINRSVSNAPPPANVVDGEDVRITFANRIAANISRRRDAQGKLAVTRAAYAIGEDATPGDGASSLRATLGTIDLDAWREALRNTNTAKPPPVGEPAPSTVERLIPERIDVKATSLRVAGRSFDNVVLDAQRSSSGWNGNISADQIAGRLSYVDVSGTTSTRTGIAAAGTGRLVARLTRLSIPQSEAGAVHVDRVLDASKQKDFPAIDLVADRFELRGRQLGRLEVVARNVAKGNGDDARREWQLEKLGLATPEATFRAKGVWGHAGANEDTRLDFSIDTSDAGALLERFGLRNTFKGGTAKLSGRRGVERWADVDRLRVDGGRPQARGRQGTVPQGRPRHREAAQRAQPAGTAAPSAAGLQRRVREGFRV